MRSAARASVLSAPILLALAGLLAGCSWLGLGDDAAPAAAPAPIPAAAPARGTPSYEAAPVPPAELMERQP